MKTQSPVRTLAQAGLIAAMYAALTLLLPPRPSALDNAAFPKC